MSSCERCWRDAGERMELDPSKSKTEHYMEILAERRDNPCTPAQQRGEDAEETEAP